MPSCGEALFQGAAFVELFELNFSVFYCLAQLILLKAHRSTVEASSELMDCVLKVPVFFTWFSTNVCTSAS